MTVHFHFEQNLSLMTPMKEKLNWHLQLKPTFLLLQTYFQAIILEKSRIRETKHLSTDAHSSTDAIGGWTKNTQNPDFFE